MHNLQKDFMRLLFGPEDLARHLVASEAMRAEVARMAALASRAMLSTQACALRALAMTPTLEMIEGFSRQLKPLLSAMVMDRRQQAAISAFAHLKLRWTPHPALRRIIGQMRREMQSEAQPQELNTMA